MTDNADYQRLRALGINITPGDENSDSGVSNDELRANLSPERYAAWRHWSRGTTCSLNGAYPWDVERFLEGLPNDD